MNNIQDFINKTKNKGMVLGLDTMRALVEKLGNPQNKPKNIIHLAGTNGKGSVGAFIESALLSSGYTVGRYTSPAVFEHFEVFKKNGRQITQDEYDSLMKIVMDTGLEPTEFEAETALAFLFVSDCDYAIIETGLGGAEDATNVIDAPKTAVLTSISLDHTGILGDTIAKITQQKCGIFNDTTTVVSAIQTEEALEVIKKSAGALPLKIAKQAKSIRTLNDCQIFDYGDIKDIKISLMGEFQIDNAATAIEALLSLGIAEDKIKDGLKNAEWHGRFERISKKPIVILDGAHNERAFYELKKTLLKYYPNEKYNFITGVLRDKAYSVAAELFSPIAESVYTITPPSPRALDKAEFAEEFKRCGINAAPIEINEISNVIKSNCVNIIFGSLSFMSRLRELLNF